MGQNWKGAWAAVLLAAASLGLGACSHAGNVGAIATDYNRAIATVRSEQVLLNVLRASAREPLQFTAVGEITATVDRSVGIDTVATNLLAGGGNAISPTLSLSGGTTPIVRIAPLSSQEFAAGFLRPITPEALQLFITQGWDGEFLLPLVVGSYTCNGQRFDNNGEGADGERVRDRLAAVGGDFRLRQMPVEGRVITMTASSDRALEMLSRGVAPGHEIVDVSPGSEPGTSVARIRQPDGMRWMASAAGLCDAAADTVAGFDGEGDVTIQLRSPQGIIYFIGESFRPCYLGRRENCDLTYSKDGELRHLFRIRQSLPPSQAAAVSAVFYDARYWIPRLDSDDTDRTLKAVAFLDLLIALQTSATALSVTPTLIAIPPG